MDAATRQLVTGLDPRLHASIERFVLLVLAREEIDVEVLLLDNKDQPIHIDLIDVGLDESTAIRLVAAAALRFALPNSPVFGKPSEPMSAAVLSKQPDPGSPVALSSKFSAATQPKQPDPGSPMQPTARKMHPERSVSDSSSSSDEDSSDEEIGSSPRVRSQAEMEALRKSLFGGEAQDELLSEAEMLTETEMPSAFAGGERIVEESTMPAVQATVPAVEVPAYVLETRRLRAEQELKQQKEQLKRKNQKLQKDITPLEQPVEDETEVESEFAHLWSKRKGAKCGVCNRKISPGCKMTYGRGNRDTFPCDGGCYARQAAKKKTGAQQQRPDSATPKTAASGDEQAAGGYAMRTSGHNKKCKVCRKPVVVGSKYRDLCNGRCR